MSFEKSNNLYQKALLFSKEIVLLYRQLETKNVENEISKQLLKNGTMIGAYISESQCSNSEPEYLDSIQHSHRELFLTKYWLDLLKENNDINEELYEKLSTIMNELSKIMSAMIRGIRSKKVQ